MWHSYRVRWGTEEYRAVPEPRPDRLWMRLQRSSAADGFEQVIPELYVRVVPADECETILFVTTVCEWRGSPFQVHDERGDELLLEYTGGEVPTAQRLGLQRVERGVYRRWVLRGDVRALRENLTELSQ